MRAEQFGLGLCFFGFMFLWLYIAFYRRIFMNTLWTFAHFLQF